jgi:hypothetical protein
VSFNKKIIPNKKNYLKKEYLEIGHDKFVKKYSSYDAYFVGNYTNSYFINWVMYNEKPYKLGIYEINQFIYRLKELGVKGIISNINYKLKKNIKYVLGSKS